ncbi:hypothetical protein Tcan_03816 [Toxocara canis]|uniref:Uncharacterized protein n=2 Tax=Toxocara canis TaxID=6265 RepID=A0A0B2VH80_TOXCA|nr:hypothetical protein Tcan_03816 [Toxocara canis]VDM45587.1 unnamed protein product [Toxocara canis]
MPSTFAGDAITTFATVDDEVEDEGLFEIPIAHHLVPVVIMGFILLLLLLACLYDCKINRDCFRKRSDSIESNTAKPPSIYLYNGETGETRPSDRP